MFDWPEEFPASCPPEDAVLSDGVFYRLVDADPVTAQDFYSHKQRVDVGLDRPQRTPPDPCLAVGVSVFDGFETANSTRQAFGALRKKQLAAGSLASSGVVKRTGERAGHHTWWRPADDTAWQSFVVVT